jgi:hypothetical protein
VGFSDIIANLKKDMGGHLDTAVANIPVASAEAASLALDLASRAREDVLSCRDNYKQRRFAKAAEDLQQAVEKGAKTFGLLTGTVRSTDAEMKAVGHDSFKAFILHFWDFYPKLVAVIVAESEIPDSKLLDNFVMRGTAKKLRKITDALKQTIPSDDKLKAEIYELNNLDSATMWKASLDLDETNKWIGSAMSGMRQKVLITDNLQTLVGIGYGAVSLVKVFDRQTMARTKLAAAVGKTGQKLFSLSLLTCWHLEPARYPPVGKYWDLSAYNESRPFIKAMPGFTKHTGAAIESAIQASKMALSLNGANSLQ